LPTQCLLLLYSFFLLLLPLLERCAKRCNGIRPQDAALQSQIVARAPRMRLANWRQKRNAAWPQCIMAPQSRAPQANACLVEQGHRRSFLAALPTQLPAVDDSTRLLVSVARLVNSAAQDLASAAQLTPCAVGLAVMKWSRSAVLPAALAAALQVLLNAALKVRNASFTPSTHLPQTLRSVFQLCRLS